MPTHIPTLKIARLTIAMASLFPRLIEDVRGCSEDPCSRGMLFAKIDCVFILFSFALIQAIDSPHGLSRTIVEPSPEPSVPSQVSENSSEAKISARVKTWKKLVRMGP